SQKPAAFQKLTGNEQDRNRKASVFGQRPPPAGFFPGQRPPPAGCCCCRSFLCALRVLRVHPGFGEQPAASSQHLSYAITEKELNADAPSWPATFIRHTPQ